MKYKVAETPSRTDLLEEGQIARIESELEFLGRGFRQMTRFVPDKTEATLKPKTEATLCP